MSGQATLDPPPPRAGIRTARGVRLLGVVTGAVAVALVTTFVLWMTRSGHAARQVNVPASWARPVVSAAGLADRSGVKITQVAVTGGGGLVDLRFQVIDPDKANALHMSHSHTGAFKPGVTYYYVFNNPGEFVQRGARVVVLLGNAQVEHVKVQ